MEPNRRYTLMAFPQGFDGTRLSLNILLLPRNRDPFAPLTTGLPGNPSVTPFANVVPQFSAGIVRGTDELPWGNATGTRQPVSVPLNVVQPANKQAILQAVEAQFAGKLTLTDTDKAEPVRSVAKSVKKYLPTTYRSAFNFTRPRHPNAVTDDSYACALRDDQPKRNVVTTDNVSWGQVFGYLLRQPLLARAAGLVYQTELTVEPDWFAQGGYLYIDLTNADYVVAQQEALETTDGPFVKRYAARIPKLEAGVARSVFAPLQFPVLHKRAVDPTDPEPPKAPYDEIFAETAEYSDGFAKIVHANQPVSGNLLAEQPDGFQPVNDLGIRLGWDDEQLLIWYLRQLTENPADPGSGERVDTPLGVFGYRVDVRGEGADWESLNVVETTGPYSIGNTPGVATPGDATPVGNVVGERLELPFQVYPTQPNGDPDGLFWLPMYYANWIGRSLVQKDDAAARIYRHADALSRPVPPDQLFRAVGPDTPLRYGQTYNFRVRLMDLTGGGPDVTQAPLRPAPAPEATVDFRRYVVPAKLRLAQPPHVQDNKDQAFNEPTPGVFDRNPTLTIGRPRLGYPAVVFTGKYQAIGQDPVQLLIDNPTVITNPTDNKTQVELGIADPDVVRVAITVEVETLRMDNRDSLSGQENYLVLYETARDFSADFAGELSLPVEFIDDNVLRYGAPNPFSNDALDLSSGALRLPTARRVRVTLRGIAEGDDAYFGHNDGPHNSRLGQPTQLAFYAPSLVETDLLAPVPNVPVVQAIYLQPDALRVADANPTTFFQQVLFGQTAPTNQPDVVQRLAHELGLDANGLTLVGPKGTRVVFACSSRIRHALAPDHSSITFASKGDLVGHWLGCVTYRLNRDWAWDALEPTSFSIERTKRFRHDPPADAESNQVVGDWELKRTASFEAQQQDRFGRVNREHTLLVFIDAIEPKTALKQPNGAPQAGAPRFPDELLVDYVVTARPRPNHPNVVDTTPDPLALPTTVNPAQVPTLVSAGMAFSPYVYDTARYTYTEARQRYLWLEFAEPVHDPNDTLFCRVLASAPDQLLSNNAFDLLVAPPEPPLNLDPEYIRVIVPGQSDDLAGIGAMQPMLKAKDSDRHYLVPLPPGLHPESPDLFGFFTYEIRVGHGHWSDRADNLWSTAQARFGRALRVTGVQHPAPNLLCTLNRDEKRLYVSAPYAQAVANGRNVTADPPRTELWALLYAQVRQADGRAYRNILLDEQRLDWRRRLFLTLEKDKNRLELLKLSFEKRPLTPQRVKQGATVQNRLLGAQLALLRDRPKTGTAVWQNGQISQRLALFGLPADASLSVVVVEVFGHTTNITEHMPDLFRRPTPGATTSATTGAPATATTFGINSVLSMEMKAEATTFSAGSQRNASRRAGVRSERLFDNDAMSRVAEEVAARQIGPDRSPLSGGLGHYRILRTSPLTPVPFVCCTDC